MRHITKISDLLREDLSTLVQRACYFREQHRSGVRRVDVLGGRVVALVFEKPSLRTKVTFEVAALSLGGFAVFLSSDQIFASGGNQHGRESVPDIARNLERFCDIIVARVFHHETIRELATLVSVPVVNALCDSHHPCQAIADVMTMEAHFGVERPRLRVAYVGDGNNVATSLIQACAMRGHDVVVASPRGYEIPEDAREESVRMCSVVDQVIEFGHDARAAVEGADVVYTDTFVSMGQEQERAMRLRDFGGYQVNEALMALAPAHSVFMHCLPAHRGEEVTDEVMDSPRSIVFDQAENRLHVAKAVLSWCLERE